jgi:hypothetical protein
VRIHFMFCILCVTSIRIWNMRTYHTPLCKNSFIVSVQTQTTVARNTTLHNYRCGVRLIYLNLISGCADMGVWYSCKFVPGCEDVEIQVCDTIVKLCLGVQTWRYKCLMQWEICVCVQIWTYKCVI